MLVLGYLFLTAGSRRGSAWFVRAATAIAFALLCTVVWRMQSVPPAVLAPALNVVPSPASSSELQYQIR